MFKYLWNTTKRIASHKEGSWYDFLFYVLRCSGLAAHASGPTALLPACFADGRRAG